MSRSFVEHFEQRNLFGGCFFCAVGWHPVDSLPLTNMRRQNQGIDMKAPWIKLYPVHLKIRAWLCLTSIYLEEWYGLGQLTEQQHQPVLLHKAETMRNSVRSGGKKSTSPLVGF